MSRIIFYQRAGAEELDRWISLNLKDGDIVFERDKHFVPRTTSGAGVSRKSYEDYLSEEDSYEIDAFALKLSENWYKGDSGNDLSLYKEVSLGKMAEYRLMKYFVSLFKDIALLLRLKEKEKASAFVFIDANSPFSGLLKSFAIRYGIEAVPVRNTTGAVQCGKISNGASHFKKNVKSIIWHLLVFLAGFCRRKITYKKTILIEAYGKFVSLVKQLAHEGNRVIVMGQLGFEKALFHPNIFYYAWPSLRGRSLACHCEQSEAILFFLDCFVANAPRNDLKAVFRSFDATPLVKKKLEEIIHQDLSDIMAFIPKINKFLIRQKADTIITLQDRDGINRILVSCGNFLGLKTIEVQHGTLSNLPYLVSPISRMLCVWGEASKKFYLKRKVEENKIYVVGNPNLESLKRISSSRITGLKKNLGLSPEKPIVLFASQPFIRISSLDSPLKTLDLFGGICEAAQELQKIEFLIKFHPSENSEIKKEQLKNHRTKNIFVAQRGLIDELLSLSHVLITFCSSIVLEASLLEIPIIMVNLTGKRDFLPLVEMGGALGVYQKNDLIPSIKSAIYEEKIRKNIIQGQKRFITSQVDLSRSSLKRMVELI